MTLRNPTLIISLLRQSPRSNSRSIRSNDRNLIFRINSFLSAQGGTLRALSAFASAFGLWEEGLDPGFVDEVEGSAESSEENEVEEDAGKKLVVD